MQCIRFAGGMREGSVVAALGWNDTLSVKPCLKAEGMAASENPLVLHNWCCSDEKKGMFEDPVIIFFSYNRKLHSTYSKKRGNCLVLST